METDRSVYLRPPTFAQTLFVRGLASMMHGTQPAALARTYFPGAERVQERLQKTAVTAVTSSEIAPDTSDYLAIIRAQTLIGRMIGVRPGRLNTRVLRSTSLPEANLVAEDELIPLAQFDVTSDLVSPLKVATIFPITRDSLRVNPEFGVSVLERELRRAGVTGRDRALFSPAVAGSITASASTVIDAGGATTATQMRAVIESLLDALAAAGCQFESGYWFTSQRVKARLATLGTTTGSAAFPDVAANSSLCGFPLLTSAALSYSTSGGGILGFVDAARLTFADGEVEVDTAVAASLQLSDAPSASPANLVSLFQTNTVAFRIVQHLGFLVDAACVGYIDGVH
jgi:hypothetical protein